MPWSSIKKNIYRYKVNAIFNHLFKCVSIVKMEIGSFNKQNMIQKRGFQSVAQGGVCGGGDFTINLSKIRSCPSHFNNVKPEKAIHFKRLKISRIRYLIAPKSCEILKSEYLSDPKFYTILIPTIPYYAIRCQ